MMLVMMIVMVMAIKGLCGVVSEIEIYLYGILQLGLQDYMIFGQRSVQSI